MTGKLLVVDPVATNRIVFKAKIAAHFYDVESVASVDQAIAAASDAPPDLVLVSDRLPEQGTAQLCAAIRAQSDLADIPILVLSDRTSGPDRAQDLLAGADDVLDRSAGDEALLARIRSLLRDAADRRDLAARLSPSVYDQAARIDWHAERPGAIGWISTQRAQALGIQARLRANGGGRIQLLDPKTILSRADTGAPLELYVVDQRPGREDTGLGLLSDLGTRANSREAAVLLLMETPYDMAAAYDLGVGGIILGAVDPEELAARMTAILRRKRQRDRLRAALDAGLALAVVDPLTGLQNRRSCTESLATLADSDRPASILMIDIDHFKSVNDQFGHAAGDTVLKAVANALGQSLPEAEILGRIGGEEFLCVVPSAKPNEVRAMAETARRKVAAMQVQLPEIGYLQVTISLGCADWTTGASAEQTMARADAALYQAKNAGRNRVVLSDRLIA